MTRTLLKNEALLPLRLATQANARRVPKNKHVREQALKLVYSTIIGRAVYCAVKFGIADLLAEGPKSSEALAREANVHAKALERVLRLLTSVGMFREVRQGTFRNTPLSSQLRADAPDPLCDYAKLIGSEVEAHGWAELPYSVETGGQAFVKYHGMETFDFFGPNPAFAQIFFGALAELSRRQISAILAKYDFGSAKHIVDVGGADGELLINILRKYSTATGTVLDVPDMKSRALQRIGAAGLEKRCCFAGGDFFREVPAADMYTAKVVIHDWKDEDALQILHNCRRGLAKGGKLLIIEGILAPDNEWHDSKILDCIMLMMQRGFERTERQYRQLVRKAGFKKIRIIPTPLAISIIEAS